MKQYIIISYTGTQLTDSEVGYLKSSISNVLRANCDGVTDGKISIFSEDDIKSLKNIFEDDSKSKEQQAIEAAVVYIGERYSEHLTGANASYINFIIALSHDLSDGNVLLINSVKILSSHSGRISTTLAKKYGFTKSILAAIQTVYSFQKPIYHL